MQVSSDGHSEEEEGMMAMKDHGEVVRGPKRRLMQNIGEKMEELVLFERKRKLAKFE